MQVFFSFFKFQQSIQSMNHFISFKIIKASKHKGFECKMTAQNNEANNHHYYIRSSITDTSTGESLLHSESHVDAGKFCTKMIINNKK